MANVDGETVGVEPCAGKKYIVKCRSRKLIKLIEDFNELQREAVRRTGFGGLLDLTVSNFDLDNVHYFVEKFKDRSYVFRATESKEFMISRHDVHDCFLLPLGPNELKLSATGPRKDENEAEVRLLKDRWRREFGIRQPGGPIPVGKLAAAIEADVEGGERFVRLFVVYCFSAFLCPTKNCSVDVRILAVVEDVSVINQYDCLKLV